MGVFCVQLHVTMAEEEGFEPSTRLSSVKYQIMRVTALEAVAISHSATLPTKLV